MKSLISVIFARTGMARNHPQ